MAQAFQYDTKSPNLLSFLIDVQAGRVVGHSLIHKFGRNPAVPSGSWAFVSLLQHTGWPLSAPTTVRIKAGGNAADTAAGAGAREVTVQGIDDSFNEVSETIATAGASASSATTASFWRVHRAWVSAVGTYGGANTGAVVIENSGAGTDLIQIAAAMGQTQFTGYTIPIGKTGYLLSWRGQVASGGVANLALYTRDDIDDTSAPMKAKRMRDGASGVAGPWPHSPEAPLVKFLAKSDVWVEAMGIGGAPAVSAELEILLVDD